MKEPHGHWHQSIVEDAVLSVIAAADLLGDLQCEGFWVASSRVTLVFQETMRFENLLRNLCCWKVLGGYELACTTHGYHGTHLRNSVQNPAKTALAQFSTT